jgi:hypothetical protein
MFSATLHSTHGRVLLMAPLNGKQGTLISRPVAWKEQLQRALCIIFVRALTGSLTRLAPAQREARVTHG